MKRLAFISDVIFVFFSITLFTLCLFRYLKISLLISIGLALCCGTLASVAFFSFTHGKRQRVLLKRSEEKEKEKLMTHLAFLSDEETTNFFLQYFHKLSTSVKRFGKLRIYTQEAFYTLRFTFTPVNADDVLRFSRIRTSKKKIILCANVEVRAQELAKKLGISILLGEEIYQSLKEYDCLPTEYLGVEGKRKPRLQRYFSRANAKRFFVAAVLLLVSALLSPFPYYYVLLGGILLFSSLCIKIFGYTE